MEECIQYSTIYIKFKKCKTILCIAGGYQEELYPLLSLGVSVFLFHRNVYLVFELSCIFVCILIYVHIYKYICMLWIYTYIHTHVYGYVCMYVCFWSREDASKQEVTKPPGPEVLLIFLKCSNQREQS